MHVSFLILVIIPHPLFSITSGQKNIETRIKRLSLSERASEEMQVEVEDNREEEEDA